MQSAPEPTGDAFAELVSLVASVQQADDAIQRGLEYIATTLHAEFCAIARNRTLEAAHGSEPEGPCARLEAPMEDGTNARLVAVRKGAPFTDADQQLLAAFGRVLWLGVGMLKRQTLLERLSHIQRSIVHRVALREILDGIVDSASDLLGDDVAVLRLVEPHNKTQMVLAAASGVPDDLIEIVRRAPVGEGISGRAISEDQLVVEESYATWEGGRVAYRDRGLQAAMATPVHENGVPVGSLTVASFRPGRAYSNTDRDMLLALADHATLALTDARNFEDAMHQAFHDPLTGLPNRALFIDRLELAQARARRTEREIAVLFLDLDGFKQINDNFGHAAGDQLLVMVAQRLQRWLRPADTAARFGGDEFAILLEDLDDVDAAADIARRILESLREPFVLQGHEVDGCASIGIACSSQVPGGDLLRNADLAMYRAKRSGKSRVQMFEPGMQVAVLERLELELDLERALRRAEMVLHYQPIVDLATSEITALEALVRWRHPARGLLLPGEFLSVAEETGQIHRLGRWIMEQAVSDARGWSEGRRPVRIGVNVSGRELGDVELVDQVSSALHGSGLPAEQLVLEITETVLMQDIEATVEKIRELKRLGVRLSVDDFGTGYSSLDYLRRFPLDSLKIAKSFVDRLSGPSEDLAVARAIIDLATSFDLRVIAEGIERPEQLDRLQKMGCTHGQGYLYSRPVPIDQVSSLLQSPQLPAARGV